MTDRKKQLKGNERIVPDAIMNIQKSRNLGSYATSVNLKNMVSDPEKLLRGTDALCVYRRSGVPKASTWGAKTTCIPECRLIVGK